MKQKLRKWFFLMSFIVASANLYAYDFIIGGIAYNVNPDKATCTVTYNRTNRYGNANSTYSGKVVVPARVSHQGKSYIVSAVGENTFRDCNDLTRVELPNTVKAIGPSAFYGCVGVRSVSVGNSLVTVGNEAFSKCSKLEKMVLPNSVKTIGFGAFSDCISLSSISFGKYITRIGTNAFENCKSLTSITVPNMIREIELGAFSKCSALKKVILGKSVERIGKYAFSLCLELEEIYCLNPEPPKLENRFSFTQLSSISVFVPDGAAYSYKNAIGWRDFSNIYHIKNTITSK